MPEIWFWQRIVSPHMAELAVALARLGCRVVYVVEREMSDVRAAQGWCAPELHGVDVRYARTKEEILFQVAQSAAQAVHLCQGIRANGLTAVAQNEIARRGCKFWILMEAIDDSGLAGVAKRLVYRYLFWQWRKSIQGILAIGGRTPEWIGERGVLREKIFPFAYFLEDASMGGGSPNEKSNGEFRFLFVGQLIERKRLDLLCDALARVAKKRSDFRLQIVGAGPLEEELRAKTGDAIGYKVEWQGTLSMKKARQTMATADCLILPSRHDGWGAVISEALMSGTPAICSHRCGAAEVVLASGTGGVFPAGDLDALERLLTQRISEGPQTSSARQALARWADSLSAAAGARYLLQIVRYQENFEKRPVPPWHRAERPV